MPVTLPRSVPASARQPAISVQVLATLALVGAATLWGTSLAATKAAMVSMPPTQLACLRFLIGAVLLGALSRWAGRNPEFSLRTATLGLTGVTLYFATQNAGLQNAAAGDATVILGGGIPLASSILGIAFLGERLGRLQLAGLICSLAGMVLVGSVMNGTGAHSALGLALLLAAVLSAAIYATLGRRAYQEQHLLPILAGCAIYGAIFLIPLAMLEARSTGAPILTLHSLGLLIYLGAGCSALGFALWAFGLRHLTAVQNALVSNLELPVGLVAAAALGEHLGSAALVGGLLVVLGATLAVARWPRRAAPATP
ncbi:MAG: EamA family transporter [Thermomicrobiales bacterium]|nr:EamA family transporter [Thermomicrobiales bacterium]